MLLNLCLLCRETQLRAFYSTTEEISVLFAKQQEQLKAMQRTLEDEENYENTSVDIDLNQRVGVLNGIVGEGKEVTGYPSGSAANAGSAASALRFKKQVEISSDEASVTEKHECDARSQEEGQNTQEAEFTSADHGVKGGFGSDIDGGGTAPVMEVDGIGTELVPETESTGINGEQNIDLNKSNIFYGDTMQLDEGGHVQVTDGPGQMTSQEALHQSQSNTPLENPKGMEDTETGGTIRTADLLASEVAGSWACSTAPSVHGDNESPCEDNNEKCGTALQESEGGAAESQSTPSSEGAARRRKHERGALSEMIGIVAPDLKEQFGVAMDDGDQLKGKHCSTSDSDTESSSDNEEKDNRVDAKGASISDAETEGSDQADENQKMDDGMDEDEATEIDSLG